MRSLIHTNSLNSVGVGQTATLDLPVGGRVYHAVFLYYDTTTANGGDQTNIEAEIDRIRVLIDGRVQRDVKPSELFSMLAFDGQSFQQNGAAEGIIPIWFSEPWNRSVTSEDALGWGTEDVNTLQIEVDIAAGAGTPTLHARALIERVARPLGPIVKYRRHRVPVSATGWVQFTTLPKDQSYFRLHCFENTDGDITEAKVVVDQVNEFNAERFEIDSYYTDLGLSPQTAHFVVAFDPTQRIADTLDPAIVNGRGQVVARVSELRAEFNMGAANAFDMVTEEVGARF